MRVPRKSLILAVPVVALLAAGGYAAYGRWRAARACCPVSGEHRMARAPAEHGAAPTGDPAECPYLKSQAAGKAAETLPVARTAPVEQWLKEGRTQKEGGSHDVE